MQQPGAVLCVSTPEPLAHLARICIAQPPAAPADCRAEEARNVASSEQQQQLVCRRLEAADLGASCVAWCATGAHGQAAGGITVCAQKAGLQLGRVHVFGWPFH